MKRIKRLASGIIAVIFAACLNFYASSEEYKIPDVKAYIITETETGEILYSSGENEKLPLSSLAKIMTLIIIADNIESGKLKLDDSIPTSAKAGSMKGAVIWLEPGEIMTAAELIKAVAISSANDACVALAEYISGSEEEFVKLMNLRASALGMKNTVFTDCGGFDDKSISTAYDISLMTAELFKRSLFNKDLQTRLSSVRTGTDREAQLLNTNKLISSYNGVLGGKAGRTDNAGYCLSACAEQGGMRLVSVVLGAKNEDDRLSLSEHLFYNAFANFELVVPEPDISKYSPIKVERGVERTIEAAPEKTTHFVVPKGEGNNVEYIYSVPESIKAPVSIGQAFGGLIVKLGEKTIFECDIIALTSADELTFFKSFEIMLKNFFKM